jgi:putative spermidine/putrescine transport system ATP-binding protein
MEDYVHLHGITRRFGSVTAVDRVDLTVGRGELVSLVGPSGAGKTTLLKLLAGLDDPTEGWIERREAITRDHPAILVFQDYLLFPHLTVFENVAFGLRSRRRHSRLSRRAIRERVTRYLEHLGIAEKAEAWPGQLSGGQKQRVALARALVMEPTLLLLDEPFANLDRTLTRDTARFIRGLQRELGVTTVIVSHDLDAAGAISDRIGVMIDGALHQHAPYREILERPASDEVARLFGTDEPGTDEPGTDERPAIVMV